MTFRCAIAPPGRRDRAPERAKGGRDVRTRLGALWVVVAVVAIVATSVCTMTGQAAAFETSTAVGSLDAISIRANPATSPCPSCTLWSVTGWAADPALPGAEITAAVTVDGLALGGDATGGVSRPDVVERIPFASATAGWHGLVAVPGDGKPHDICAIARGNARLGAALLGCVTVTPDARHAGDPRGHVDAASARSGRLEFSGWAGDPDEGALGMGGRPTQVRLLLDGFWFEGFTAEHARPDVHAAIPELVNAGGFVGSVPVPPGEHRWCLHALNSGSQGRSNPAIGCGQTMVPASSSGVLGAVDSVHQRELLTSPVVTSGWAWSPSAGRLDVRVEVVVVGTNVLDPAFPHSVVSETRTGRTRPDVGAVHPFAGQQTGFAVSSAIEGRPAYACAYALIDGHEELIGCRGATFG
jgi:hypothetical protein